MLCIVGSDEGQNMVFYNLIFHKVFCYIVPFVTKQGKSPSAVR